VPYKGPALAEELYGNLGLRSCFDLDLVVAMADVAGTREALFALGYETASPLDGPEREFFYQVGYHERFVRSPWEVVELHWGFTGAENRVDLGMAELGPTLQERPLAGRAVLAFDPESLFLILCLHGAKHRWHRLELIAGAAQVVRDHPSLDWDATFARARALGCGRIMLLGAFLVHEYCGAPVPDEFRARFDNAPVVRRLAESTRRLLMEDVLRRESEQEMGSLPNDLYRFRLRERAADRIRFVGYRLAHPSRPHEWRVYRLGRTLIPVHSLIRPFRVAGKVLVGTFRVVRGGLGIGNRSVADVGPGASSQSSADPDVRRG
jgi:hypothetical protein